LVWALVTSLVLLIIVGIVASIVTVSYRQTAASQTDTQAYYTARSVSERITNWLSGTSATIVQGGSLNNQQMFISELTQYPTEQFYSEKDLGGSMGTAKVYVSINSSYDVITIVTTGFFGEQQETITSTLALSKSGGFTYQNAGFPAQSTSNFATREDGLPSYETREKELNGRRPDESPTVVGNEPPSPNQGDWYATMADYNNNIMDAAVANGVRDAGDELTWRMYETGDETYFAEILGTAAWTSNLDSDYENTIHDSRHFLAPENGRWTINPLYRYRNAGTGSKPENSSTAENNTRPIMISLNGTLGKHMELRLGGDATNNAPTSGEGSYYNSLMGFDLTDNASTTTDNPFVEYYDDNVFARAQALWHPQRWGSMTVYTQTKPLAPIQAGVEARLVFGPYMRIFRKSLEADSAYGDYWNWGRYVGNPWYGQDEDDWNEAFPDTSYPGTFGMAYIPEYYGNDAQFFFLDTSEKPVLFIQGVNILDQNNVTPTDPRTRGVIYARRGVEIGGGLVKTTSAYDDALGQTTRHVNSNVDGFSYGTAPYAVQYFGTTARYSQILYNTDIVLRTPEGTSTPRTSRIFDATLPTDGAYGQNDYFASVTDKKFSPTVRIIGGDIYVGAGQTLTIDGGRINPKASADTVTFEGHTVALGTSAGEYTQVVAPNAITVAEGGTLVIRGQADAAGAYVAPSAYANVDAPIYVEGTLNIEQGARMTNQVFCYNGGVVNINAPANGTTLGEHSLLWSRRIGELGAQDGLFIFAGGTLNTKDGAGLQAHVYVGGGGVMNIAASTVIQGDIDVVGTLNIASSLHLTSDSADLVDDPRTDVNEASPELHGIFIYNDLVAGAGTLNISNPGAFPPAKASWTNTGGIHTFAPVPGITTNAASIFCAKRNETTNVCQHWTTVDEVWMPQGAVSGVPE
jgi:hypothetical protein